MRYLLILLLLLGVTCTTNVVLKDSRKLFLNTLKRWDVPVSTPAETTERFNRLLEARDLVERSTRGVTLEHLNRFSVNTDAEHQTLMRMIKRSGLNFTQDTEDMERRSLDRSRLVKRSSELPEENHFWMTEVEFKDTTNQGSCGSCWAFPATAALESLYRELTGEASPDFSEQYLVDCTFDGSGCGGGTVNQAYKKIKTEQYIPSEQDMPYLHSYSGECTAAGKKNAMKKILLQDWFPLSTSESGVLTGLKHSPVALGTYIGDAFWSYTGGIFTDDCGSSGVDSHAMLLIGYTQEYLVMRNSYGPTWGENGNALYDRGAKDALAGCNFFNSAFYIRATPRREMEYEFCAGGKMKIWGDCQTSCQAMNTADQSGWDLAVIPSQYHYYKVIAKIDKKYGDVKNDDEFNILWVGVINLLKAIPLSF